MHSYVRTFMVAAVVALAACGGSTKAPVPVATVATAIPTVTVHDTTVASWVELSGTATPVREATLGTRLMGAVTVVLVAEGDRVREGQLLARVDARDLVAREAQVQAGIAGADAAVDEARRHAARMRALNRDSAATRAQLEAAEAGLVRAEAGLRSAQAGAVELSAIKDYAAIRAPFAGIVTQRLVDPGSFVAPGTPLLVIQDQRQLRVTVTADPVMARRLVRGSRVAVSIEDRTVEARVEAVIPAATVGMHSVQALVDNRDGTLLAGGAAVIRVPRDSQSVVLVPTQAIRREGDLTGVTVTPASGVAHVRWVRLGRSHGALVEVLSGLRAGESIQVPVTGGR